MKSNELRIGNYIQVPFGNEEPWVRSVDSINYDSIMTENGRFCFEDEYDFVPLTEEWLLKFGFERTKHGFSIVLIEIRGRGTVMFGNDASRRNIGWVRYLHELQNLYFALTGKELTIK